MQYLRSLFVIAQMPSLVRASLLVLALAPLLSVATPLPAPNHSRSRNKPYSDACKFKREGHACEVNGFSGHCVSVSRLFNSRCGLTGTVGGSVGPTQPVPSSCLQPADATAAHEAVNSGQILG